MDSAGQDEVAPSERPGGPRLSPNATAALLFVATLGTTTWFGGQLSETALTVASPWSSPLVWAEALSYSLPIMAILLCHELGHYLTARHYGVGVSPPYFLPGFPPFGTFGAFIKMEMGRIPAVQLFRIGAGGPYAGFVVALPVLVCGLLLSDVRPLPADFDESMIMGDSLLMLGLIKVIFGAIPEHHDVFLHPMAYAGWVGMFVTSFNLVPLGQLDGGHIAYTLFGERFNQVAPVLFAAMIALGIFVFQGWLVLGAFVAFMGMRHPPIMSDRALRSAWDRAAGYGALLMFVLTFVPRPFNVSLWALFG